MSPECTDGDVHEYLSMLITIDQRAGTMTFQMPKLSIKLKALLESMGDRAKKRGKYCRKEIYVRGEPMNVSSKGLPLVWKLEIFSQRYGQNVYPTS